jgi:hypothetical protein
MATTSGATKMPHHDSPTDWVQDIVSEHVLDQKRELVIIKHTQAGESYLSYELKDPGQAYGLQAHPISHPTSPPDSLWRSQVYVPEDLRADHGGKNPNALHVLLVLEQTTHMVAGRKAPISEQRPVKVIEYTCELALPAR